MIRPLAAALFALTACAGTSLAAPTTVAGPDLVVTGPQGRVGQFVVTCRLARMDTIDPIVHPGHDHAGHLHAFFGNEAVTASATREDLLGAATSCLRSTDTAAYWAPALLGSDGEVVPATSATAYYRAGPGVDPATVSSYPPGLKMIAGDAGATMPQPVSVVAWTCGSGASRAAAPPACVGRAPLRLVVTFPDCWDGVHLDVADHRSHVAYSSAGACPGSHPVAIPQLQLAIDHAAVADPSSLRLSSGPIATAHADFWNTWDQAALDLEVAACINRDLVCGVTDPTRRGSGG